MSTDYVRRLRHSTSALKSLALLQESARALRSDHRYDSVIGHGDQDVKVLCRFPPQTNRDNHPVGTFQSCPEFLNSGQELCQKRTRTPKITGEFCSSCCSSTVIAPLPCVDFQMTSFTRKTLASYVPLDKLSNEDPRQEVAN